MSSPAAAGITELDLYGENTFPLPMSAEVPWDVFTHTSRCTLTYPALPWTRSTLAKAELRSRGLSFMPEGMTRLGRIRIDTLNW
jgi:hypothetical protein